MKKTIDQARGKWRDLLIEAGIPKFVLSGSHCGCPLCGGKDRFRYDDRTGSGDYFCNHCGAGNGFNLLMEWKVIGFAEAAKWVDERIGRIEAQPIEAKSVDTRKLVEFGRGLEKIKAHDPVARYLDSRCLSFNDYLRIHPEAEYWADNQMVKVPAMVGLFTNALNKPVAYHRTLLLGNGEKVRRVLGQGISGAAIRLSPVTQTLGIAEGIETALSVKELYGIDCWATYSKTNMESFVVPEGVEKIHVFSDVDKDFGGQLSAVKAAQNIHAQGVEVHLEPFLTSGDYNDYLQTKVSYGFNAKRSA